MSSSSVPEGPGSVSGTPHLPEGFAATFTSRYIDTGDLRQHVVTGGEGAANTMKLAASDVQSVVIPGCGHYCLEEAPEEIVATLTAFLAPYRDRPAVASNPGRTWPRTSRWE
jgi:hypothetical protein